MAVARLHSFVNSASRSSLHSIKISTSYSHRTLLSSSGSLSLSSQRISTPSSVAHFHSSSRRLAEENKSQAEVELEEKEELKEDKKMDPQESKIQALQKEVEDLKSKLIYSYAERENIRRISNIEVEKARDFGIQSFAKSLLDSADNFTRCMGAAKKEDLDASPAFKAFFEGVQMTEKILLKAFKNNGLDKFEPSTEKFDPNTMNALMFMQDPTKQNGFVGAVLKPGYILNKRVVRAADVGVVKNPSVEEESS